MNLVPPPLTDAEILELRELLAAVPEPLEAPDADSLDGFLCGVLLQPREILPAQWLRFVTDVDGRPAPAGPAVQRIHTLAQRRHAELGAAIGGRQWFDPWLFAEGDDAPPQLTLRPWVAGFSAAMEHFPALLQIGDDALIEPLAILFANFDPEDLEDANDLVPVIETLEPPADLEEAVEDAVRAVLLIADISRPQRPLRSHRPPATRSSTPRKRR